jgi:hypothetical protein
MRLAIVLGTETSSDLPTREASDVRMATTFIDEYLKKSGRLERQHD